MTETATAQELTGRRIWLARQGAGMTARDLADRAALRLWDIEQLEAGRVSAAGPELERIAAVTGTSVARLRGTSHRQRPAMPDAPLAHLHTTAERARTWLVLGSLLALIGVRFFTEVVAVLPRAMNFIDIAVFAALLLGAALVGPARPRQSFGLLLPATGFLAVCVVSVLVNLERVAAAPALLFVYGFLGPFVVFWAVHRVWPAGGALGFSRLLVALGCVQIAVVAFINLPEFLSSENPDVISGTFGENPYQLVFFLLTLFGLLGGIFAFEPKRRTARAVPLLTLAFLAVIFLAQYRALLVTTALTVMLLGIVLGAGRPRGALLGALTVAGLVVTLALTAQYLPFLKFGATIDSFREDPTYYVTERLQVVGDVGLLYGDDGVYAGLGTGPGTYSSRAWKTFATFDSTSESNVAGEYVAALTGGKVYRTDVSDKYVIPRMQADTVSGSRAVRSALSSWLSVSAELGLTGLVLLIALYGTLAAAVVRRLRAALRQAAHGPETALLLTAATALFVLLQMGFLENWLEVARVTFLTATIAAVAIKEFDARDPAPASP